MNVCRSCDAPIAPSALVCSACDRPTSPCREFRGVLDVDGYGKVNWGRARPGKGRMQIRLHRWVMEQVHGPLPRGVAVLHRCDNPPCFRFDHLVLGTQRDNLADMRRKGRGSGGSLPGETNPHALLTERTVVRIRELRAEGWTQQRIADEVGTTRSNVSLVIRGKSWRHVA